MREGVRVEGEGEFKGSIRDVWGEAIRSAMEGMGWVIGMRKSGGYGLVVVMVVDSP